MINKKGNVKIKKKANKEKKKSETRLASKRGWKQRKEAGAGNLRNNIVKIVHTLKYKTS